MTVLRAVGLAAGWGVALLWATRTAAWLRGMPRLPDLREETRAPEGSVSVVVPARNEEDNIAAGLRSLLASKDVAVEVVALDDRSEDRTGVIMEDLRQGYRAPGVRCVIEHIETLASGWLGKPHAMARGAALATGEWLLFTDADVIFAEDALSRALAYVEHAGVDHLVVVPTVVARSAGERMMLPFLYVLSIWGPRMWRVADPDSRDAVGVGAFNLMRRSAYDRVGGWERLRMEVIEDLRMGVVIKQAGFRSRVAVGRDLVRIRWAKGARGVVSNLTKNVFAAFRFRIGLVAAGTAALTVMCVLPFAGIVLGLRNRAWLWPSLISIASLAALYWRHRRFADPNSAASVLWLATFPAAALVFAYAMVKSTVLTLVRRGVVWRGTFYPLRELREHLGPLR
jgi:cellulose synthase/poly-beta-1,6-N-acetylglucosamine synthase-like glycosyltransferase